MVFYNQLSSDTISHEIFLRANIFFLLEKIEQKIKENKWENNSL